MKNRRMLHFSLLLFGVAQVAFADPYISPEAASTLDLQHDIAAFFSSDFPDLSQVSRVIQAFEIFNRKPTFSIKLAAGTPLQRIERDSRLGPVLQYLWKDTRRLLGADVGSNELSLDRLFVLTRRLRTLHSEMELEPYLPKNLQTGVEERLEWYEHELGARLEADQEATAKALRKQ